MSARPIFALALALVPWLVSCSGGPTFRERLPGESLMNGQFTSYSSEAEATASSTPPRTWRTVGRYGLTADDKRPVHDQAYLETAGSLLHVPGKIRLSFFNDRLYLVAFTPDDPILLEKEMRGRGLPPSDRYVEGNIEFTLRRDLNSPVTATWHDKRLAQENLLWAEKHQGWIQK